MSGDPNRGQSGEGPNQGQPGGRQNQGQPGQGGGPGQGGPQGGQPNQPGQGSQQGRGPGGQQGRGQPGQGPGGPGGGRGGGPGGYGGTHGPRPFQLETVWKLLAVAALLVGVGDLVVGVLADLVSSRPLGLAGNIKGELSDLIYSVGFFGAILWAAVTEGRRDVLYKGAGLAYLASLGDNLASAVLFPNSTPSVTTVIWPLATVTTFLGIAIAIRLYHGKTLWPGVDVRL